MADDITTSLTAALHRAVRSTIDEIAKVGLQNLKSVLDSSGFASSVYLKNYEAYAHVSGDTVTFEILLDPDAVEPADATAKKDMEEQVRAQDSLNEIKKIASHKFGLAQFGTQKIYGDSRRNARRPAKDARRTLKDVLRPAKNVFRNAEERLVGHEIALHAPRSIDMTKNGKVSISFRRSIRSTASHNFVYPKGKFGGIPDKFIQKLEKTIREKFAPKLAKIIGDRI